LPPPGRVSAAPAGLALAVRPERWLIVLASRAGGTSAARWQELLGTSGAVVELSAGLTAFYLAGAPAREVLRRGCRLDLDPEVFTAGSAAATQMAQVAVTLAALPGGLLLLTPASTARHLREWLMHVGRAFGIAAVSDATVAALSEIRSA
jgi:sarcosine oxidase subunit gamma